MRARRQLLRTAFLALAFAIAVVGCRPLGSGPASTGPTTDVLSFTIASAALSRDMRALVFHPRDFSAASTAPVLYVFHGYGGDERSWFDGSGGDGVHLDGVAQRLIDEGRICPVVIVSAAIGNSYGVDSTPAADQFDHGQYERYLVTELPRAIESKPELVGHPARRYFAGLSMGGFAALHAALRAPSMFAGVGALSPAMFVDTPKDRQWLFGGDPAGNDPLELASTARLDGLSIFLGFGDGDYGWVREGTGQMARRLQKRAVGVEPVVVPGGHDVGTWRQLAAPMLERLFAPPCR